MTRRIFLVYFLVRLLVRLIAALGQQVVEPIGKVEDGEEQGEDEP